MKKTTLVFVHPHFTIPGGAGKMLLELGSRLTNKFEIVVIALKINPEYKENYSKINFVDVGGPTTSSFNFWLKLPHWRRKVHSAIEELGNEGEIKLISSVFPANWLSLSYKKKHEDVKTFWFCQEPSAFIHIKKWRNAIQSPLKRLIANVMMPIFAAYDKKITTFADIIFANSEFSRKNIRQVYNRDSIIVYPGIDSKKFHSVDFKAKENYVLTVARLSKFKNIDLLIRTLSKLKNKNVKLKIAGDGEEKENLKSLTNELNIANRVEILSGLSDSAVADLFAKAKIFVLCSKEEPFGMVPVEAMASGTMAIADDSGGPMEIIDNNVNGLLITDMDDDKLAKEIDRLFSNEKEIEKLSSKARTKAVETFEWNLSAKKLTEVISV